MAKSPPISKSRSDMPTKDALTYQFQEGTWVAFFFAGFYGAMGEDRCEGFGATEAQAILQCLKRSEDEFGLHIGIHFRQTLYLPLGREWLTPDGSIQIPRPEASNV